MRFRNALPLFVLGLSATGCPFFGPWDDDDWDDDTAWPTTGSSAAPSVDAVSIQDWPPLGPADEVEVRLSDDVGLWWLEFGFRESVGQPVSGTTATASVRGDELGEGFGTLSIEVHDLHGGYAVRRVEDLLVDLSPPEVTIGQSVLPATGAFFEAWVADAWVLGGYELEFGGRRFRHEFEPGYPEMLGEAWDYSLVQIATDDLPATRGTASLTAWDAAGNEIETSFELTVDATPPAVAILAPAPYAAVSGRFEVTLTAADPGGGSTWVELFLGGTSVATAVGPNATVELDASEFAPGALDLAAIATDEAGNESVPVVVPLVVEE